jgi:hypothetical protein
MITPSSSAAAGLPPVASSGPMSALSAVTTPAAAASQLQQQQQHLSYQMQQFNQNQAKTQQQQQAARVQYAQSSQLQVPASQQLMAPTQVAGNPLSRSGSGQRLSHMPQQQQQHYNTQFLSSSSVATSGVSSQTMLMAQQRAAAAAAGQAQLQQQQQRPSSVLQPVQSRPGIYGLQQQPQQQLAPGSYAHHLNPVQSTGGVVARPAPVQQGTPQYGVQSQLSLSQQHAMQVCYFLLVAPFVCMWAFRTESGTTNFNWVERVCTGFAGKAEASSRADATTHPFPDNCTITCTAGYGHG